MGSRAMGRLHRARWGPHIEQWLDEELDSTRAEAVLVHVTGCRDCFRDLEALVRLKRSLSRLEGR